MPSLLSGGQGLTERLLVLSEDQSLTDLQQLVKLSECRREKKKGKKSGHSERGIKRG